MRINQNIMAMNAFRNLDASTNRLAKSLEKLSSGFRINRAADDAAGLVISQSLRAQVSGLQQATRNAQDGISVVQTAEGALTEVHSMLNRIRDLIIQSANTASSDSTARQAAQNEIDQLRSEIDRIANSTSFGNHKLLNGSFGAQEARLSATATGVAATGVDVSSAGNTFDLTLDAGAAVSVSVTVTVTTGTYATADSYEAAVQTGIDAALSGQAGFTGGATVNVRDLGGGSWSIELVRESEEDLSGIAIANAGAGLPIVQNGTAAVTNTGGGIFQVGANVTATDQIELSITDTRITNGGVGIFTALANIDVTDVTRHASSQVLVDDAIDEVSKVRGELGAAQNRFESTIANLQVTTENLSASESRIRDTNMASEMVTFTKNQILLQAGTAMLAQANAAPQTVLKLLQ
jgi:flagellin